MKRIVYLAQFKDADMTPISLVIVGYRGVLEESEPVRKHDLPPPILAQAELLCLLPSTTGTPMSKEELTGVFKCRDSNWCTDGWAAKEPDVEEWITNGKKRNQCPALQPIVNL
jgi:hypothetical protein